MPHNQLLQIRKQKNNNQSIIFYITPKAKHCKGAKILSFLYRIPDFGSLAKGQTLSLGETAVIIGERVASFSTPKK